MKSQTGKIGATFIPPRIRLRLTDPEATEGENKKYRRAAERDLYHQEAWEALIAAARYPECPPRDAALLACVPTDHKALEEALCEWRMRWLHDSLSAEQYAEMRERHNALVDEYKTDLLIR